MYLLNTPTCTALLASCLLLATPSLAKGGKRGFHISHFELDSWWVQSADVPSPHCLQMRRRPGTPPSTGYLHALRNGSQVNGVYGSEEVDLIQNQFVFATEVQVGGKPYELVLDTGSSDTWLPKPDFQCARVGTGDFIPQSDCKFGTTYQPGSTFKPIPNLNYHVQYTDGESLTGTFGTEQIEVAGITVKNQQIALVSTAQWNGDTITSGLLGLAFPAATKAFTGNNYRLDTVSTQKIYNPIFTNMYTEGFVAPLFSIALDRNEGGILAIGGLPPVNYFPIFASSPFQLLSTSSSDIEGTASSSAYTLYTITTEGFSYSNSAPSQWSYSNFPFPFGEPSDKTQVQVIIDTATTNIYLPASTADAVNALFSPPLLYKGNNGNYYVKCDATPPRFGVKIGFETFFVNPLDMIINLGDNNCISGVAAIGEGGSSVLGYTFLKNVLAVFDVGAQMMRFAAREYY